MDYLPPIPQEPIIAKLPQYETSDELKIRKARLAETRSKYTLSKNNSMGIPLLTEFPMEFEKFNDKYTLGRMVASVPIFANTDVTSKQMGIPIASYSGVAAYEELYPSYPKSEVVNDWLTDDSFAEQRLSGVNPGMLELVENLPKSFNTEKLKSTGISHDELAKLINQKNLFMVDYTKTLEGIKGGLITFTQGGISIPIQKYLPKPIALFKWQKTKRFDRLVPLAIQLDIDDCGDTTIITPKSDGMLWDIAKTCFSVADSNVHEMITHLGKAHFAQESFGAITPMQLDETHPVHILLKPHLRFMIFNNDAGLKELVQENGPVDFLLGGSLDESLSLSTHAAKTWSVKDTFITNMKARGVNSSRVLPHYPYRDDGMLLWHAINKYLNMYLKLYYKNDNDLTLDTELQNWAKELASKADNGGNILDMPECISTVDQLTEILTMIIFTASAEHSAINFTQYPYLGFSPNSPLAGYADYQSFFKNKSTDQEQLDFMLKFLPPPLMAIGQIKITGALSAYHYDKLGDYESQFADPLAKQVIYSFSQDLQAIEKRIEARNRKRAVPYKFLQPSEILNSASI